MRFGGMKGREEVQIGDIMCVKMLCKLQLIMQMGEFILLFQVLAVFLIAEFQGIKLVTIAKANPQIQMDTQPVPKSLQVQ